VTTVSTAPAGNNSPDVTVPSVADFSDDSRARRTGFSRIFRRKGRFDPQPSQSSVVLLASHGGPFPKAAIQEAVRLSGGGPVAVITIARLYGSAYGLPNPGLLPTTKEMDVQRAQVERAIKSIERFGNEDWGQVAVSRRPGKTIARAAEARGVRYVLVCAPPSPRWRQVIEGDPVKDIRRRVGTEITVQLAT
jgi:hypothetical protein